MKTRKISQGQSSKGMISTASSQATQAGLKVLNAGGNAVDAAVAAAFCLGVTEPQASGLGGQSMALVYLKEQDKLFALDGSSRAPFRIQPRKTPEKPMKTGIRATTVPSTPATLGYLHERYGQLSFSEILKPSIDNCMEGFPISALQHRLIMKEKELLLQDDMASKIYFKNGQPLGAGDKLVQVDLGNTFMTLADHGWQDFYTGKIANLLIKDMEKREGLIEAVDLGQIPIPIERAVLTGSYRGYDIHTFPPPGAGRVLIHLLNILENFPSELLDNSTIEGAVIMALAFRMALSDRQKMPIHPDYYSQVANRAMSDKAYGREVANRIDQLSRFTLMESVSYPPLSGETTHLSVTDREGNSVAITQSIELVFGSKTMATGLGFFYNNYMSAFEYKNMTHPYYLLPGGKPWSSVAPTMIFKDGKLRYVLGSPGSERIATSLVQVLTRLIDQGQDLGTAIDSPRFHVSHTGKLQLELARFDTELVEKLKSLGFEVTKRGAYSFYLGCVQGIECHHQDKPIYHGVADPRRDGTAQGPS